MERHSDEPWYDDARRALEEEDAAEYADDSALDAITSRFWPMYFAKFDERAAKYVDASLAGERGNVHRAQALQRGDRGVGHARRARRGRGADARDHRRVRLHLRPRLRGGHRRPASSVPRRSSSRTAATSPSSRRRTSSARRSRGSSRDRQGRRRDPARQDGHPADRHRVRPRGVGVPLGGGAQPLPAQAPAGHAADRDPHARRRHALRARARDPRARRRDRARSAPRAVHARAAEPGAPLQLADRGAVRHDRSARPGAEASDRGGAATRQRPRRDEREPQGRARSRSPRRGARGVPRGSRGRAQHTGAPGRPLDRRRLQRARAARPARGRGERRRSDPARARGARARASAWRRRRASGAPRA